MRRRGANLGAAALLLAAGLLGGRSGAAAQYADRPWQPVSAAPAAAAQAGPAPIAQTPPARPPAPPPTPSRWAPSQAIASTPAPGQPPPAAKAAAAKPLATNVPGAVVPIPDDGLQPPRPVFLPPGASPPQPLPAVHAEPISPRPAYSVRAGGIQRVSGEEPAPMPAVAPPAAPGAQAANVSVEVVGPEAINLGKPFTCEIVVKNAGSAAVHGIRVEGQLPAGGRYLGGEPMADTRGGRPAWTFDTLGAGAERRIKVEIQPGGEGDLQTSATVTVSASSCLRSKVTRPALTLVKKGPETAQVGDEVEYHLLITNTGSGPATHVLLRDLLPQGLQHPAGDRIEADLGTIDAGMTRDITVKAKAVRAGPLTNEAAVQADDVPPVTARTTTNVTEAALALRKVGPARAYLDHEIDYRLEVTNSGTAAATGVKVTDTLPEGLDFLSAGEGGTYQAAARAVEWAVGTLAPKETRALAVKVAARSAGDLVNRALARADRGLEARAESPLKVEGVPALMLEVVDLDDPVEVGAETTYEIRVVNQGTSPCQGVRIRAVVPDGMAALSAEGPAAYRVSGQEVVFEAVPRLAARADALYRVKVRAAKPGDLRFKAYLDCDHMKQPVYEEESTNVYKD
ncbi:MAG TPA: hypothetical protein VFA26_02835 [Gemmataceae bacterium]|nr:hypothetical protein [Gemmataceae bacterium]